MSIEDPVGAAPPSDSSRPREFVARAVIDPLADFMHREAAGGIVMLIATVIALVWANSPWDGAYHDLWEADLAIDLGFFEIEEHLEAWVNDGLMTIFFFVVGLEIKRELVRGELNETRKAALPAVAALGGMVVPALIYFAFNAGGDGAKGWGIPMATDIAFAIGLLAVAGRVPTSVKVFLLALAIVDDIGAIAVIAIFYTDSLAIDAMGVAIAMIVLVFVLQRADVRSVYPYAVVGIVLWAAIFKSGVHATIAGVTLGLLTPAWPLHPKGQFRDTLAMLLGRYDATEEHEDEIVAEEERHAAIEALQRLSRDSQSPLERLEAALHPWVSFGIVPIFALANAGVVLDGDAISAALESSVSIGVVLGLVVGKTVGILLATWIALRTGIGSFPEGARWSQIVGVAMLGGVGFTVALFVTGLAFDDPVLTDDAKIGILAGSLVAGVAGFLVIRMSSGSTVAAEPIGHGRRPD